ncbi:MAG: HAMP domain-containing protein [Opitutaceae bacterium]|jgi:HAMP domain-containing protein
MRSTLTFQTLILWMIAPLLLVLSLAWGSLVYDSVNKTILAGFDRKLLNISGNLAVLIDAEAHQAYQIPRKVAALCDGSADALFGYDANGKSLLAIDRKNGGARVIQPWPGEAPSSMAFDRSTQRLFALIDSGRKLLLLDLDETHHTSSLTLPERMDGLFMAAGSLRARSGTRVFAVDPKTGHCEAEETGLPEPVRSLASHGSDDESFALSQDGKALLHIDGKGKLAERVSLRLEDKASGDEMPELQALAFAEGKIFASGPSLAGIDVKSGIVAVNDFSSGYFSEQDPFYLRYRKALIDTRKAANLTYCYTYVYLGGDMIYYVLDGTEGPDHSLPGSEDRLPDAKSIEGAQWVQFLKRPWVSDIQQWEQWGLLKSSSHPIVNAAGDTVAVAGADVNITIIKEKTRWAVFAVLFVGVGFLVAASFVSLKIAHSLIRPLRSLKESALRIAAGNYSAAIASGNSRETASLARTLGMLGERLAEQQSRSRDYQERLHRRRRHTTLARALEDFTARHTIADQASSALSKSATGNCWRGLDGVFWHAPALESEVGAACLRARLTCLGRQLLAAQGEAADIPSAMLASTPSCSPARAGIPPPAGSIMQPVNLPGYGSAPP